MPIAETGQLDQTISIVIPGKMQTDEFGDNVSRQDKVVYEKLYAMQRSKKSDDVGEDLATLKTQAQFVIRHRQRQEKLITTDMVLQHWRQVDDQKVQVAEYQIDAFNQDTQYGDWDVIICHRVPEV
ncbi:head-tail adaptor protein [Latilactobacillus sakei subsp. sakei]|uniref:head-tail adaptor protein n=1 Tax=Latilactobacillus sakei TaxID=1599 RepID=UPI00285F9D2F|nr:head-tail adaptor protein [Latilactobacillus sakei]MDR7924428.1 head-tail adaptor protein [Latilactobacillus sakei subsp. sakei]